MATAGVRPCLSLRGWSRSLPTPRSPGWGSAPAMGTPQEPRALLRVPSHGVPSKDGWVLAVLDTTAKLAPYGYPHPQSSPTPANTPILPARCQPGTRVPVWHSPWDASWENPLPGNASWSTWGEGEKLLPLPAPPGVTILHAGFLGAVGGTGRDTAPARLREMKEQLRARGRLRACSPRLCGRPAASAAAGTNACTYLCPGTGVCSSLPRL